jgi:thymidylate synthase (FAD)
LAKVTFVKQSHTILECPDDAMSAITFAARTCYRSERLSGPDSDRKLLKHLIRNGHHAMLEHGGMISVRFTTDRAIANELVRHRLFSFAQESTRYVNYDRRGFAFIIPDNVNGSTDAIMRVSMREAAETYEGLVAHGVSPEVARSVLPLSTATDIVVSGNIREWRHALSLRCERHAHPQMRALMVPLLHELRERIPVLFDDIQED